jgi:hypothetical protein
MKTSCRWLGSAVLLAVEAVLESVGREPVRYPAELKAGRTWSSASIVIDTGRSIS